MNLPNVLIVDDQVSDLLAFTEMLRDSHYNIRQASSGIEALQLVLREEFCVVLLDVVMPGLNGLQIAELLRSVELSRRIPLIFVSGVSQEQIQIFKGYEGGAVDYLLKPVNAQILKHKVHIFVELYQQRQLLKQKAQEIHDSLEYQQRISEDLLKKSINLSQANQQLKQQTEALQILNTTKNKFFSIIAHDLRGPLGNLTEIANILVKDEAILRDQKKRKLAEAISISSQKLIDLLENLFQWARFQTGSLKCEAERVNVQVMTKNVCDLLEEMARKKEIILSNTIDPEIFIYVDPHMFFSVLQNLVVNALKFTNSQGRVSIECKAKDKFFEILITDTGIGIAPELIEKLFRLDTEFSTQGTAGEQGTGLGLILCKEFVEKNGGTLSVKSMQGSGTVCTVTFPKALNQG